MGEARVLHLATLDPEQLLAPRGVADLPAVRVQVRHQDGQAPNAQHSYILPFRRFNKNWYNAMAGAALLGNSEVAGGMYIFQKAGKDYTVVCKELHYKFLRPASARRCTASSTRTRNSRPCSRTAASSTST
ncbi:MAG: hypothetical protein ACFHWZ_00920 [Phycisphaerales bacterium]